MTIRRDIEADMKLIDADGDERYKAQVARKRAYNRTPDRRRYQRIYRQRIHKQRLVAEDNKNKK